MKEECGEIFLFEFYRKVYQILHLSLWQEVSEHAGRPTWLSSVIVHVLSSYCLVRVSSSSEEDLNLLTVFVGAPVTGGKNAPWHLLGFVIKRTTTTSFPDMAKRNPF